MRILIIGCGSIGTHIARAVDDMEEFTEVLITDQSKLCAAQLVKALHNVTYVENDERSLEEIVLGLEQQVRSRVAACKQWASLIIRRPRTLGS